LAGPKNPALLKGLKMSTNDAVVYKFINMTASGAVNTGKTRLGGIFCASSSTGTVKVWDNTAGSGTVCVNTFSVAAGTYYPIPANLQNGCYITIGGTADITAFYL
jgi:hypothetical protein